MHGSGLDDVRPDQLGVSIGAHPAGAVRIGDHLVELADPLRVARSSHPTERPHWDPDVLVVASGAEPVEPVLDVGWGSGSGNPGVELAEVVDVGEGAAGGGMVEMHLWTFLSCVTLDTR